MMNDPKAISQTLTFHVGGMDCASCAGTIKKAISGLPGTSDVTVSVPREQLRLTADETVTDRAKLAKVLKSLGFQAEIQKTEAITNRPPIAPPQDTHKHACESDCSHEHDDHHGHARCNHDHGHHHHGDGACDHDHHSHQAHDDDHASEGRTVLKVGGMDCASCAGTIRTALENMSGVSSLHVSVPRERVSLTLTSGSTSIEDVRNTIRSLGFAPGEATNRRATDKSEPASGKAWWQQPKARQLGLGAVLVAAAFVSGHFVPQMEPWAFGIATAVPLWPIARRAFVAARLGAFFTIQMLLTLAATGALVIGEQQEAAVVVVLFILGEMLEGLAADKARSGIKALGQLLPRDAHVEENGVTRTVPASSLHIGQVIVVRPGDRIAADGEVVDGVSSVDESPVTGESIPVTKEIGDQVAAGTVNHDATLRLRVNRAPEDNTIARIIALVEEAQDSQAPTERFIDRFSRIYMPIVLAVAALVAVVPPLSGFGDWETWIYRGLALLLIGCPCALVISVPAAVASSLSAGARNGMLIKGGAVIETLAGAACVVFDKTGTLTLGKPRVTDVEAFEGDTGELLSLAAAVERESSHPLATAIVSHAVDADVPRHMAVDVRIAPGKGMEGRIEGMELFIGAPRHAADRTQLGKAANARIAELEQEGKTIAIVVGDGKALGLIALRDEPRSEARETVSALNGQRIASLMMTGDNPGTGAAIGRQLGIEVEAGMLPEDKARRVQEITQRKTVVMVGDGVNDAPALAAAQVGVAIGSGTDVAMEAADAAIMRDRIDDVPHMIGLARATMSNIHQNVAIALGLKAVFLVTTVTGISGLWLAIFADTGATVLVTLNAMRLLGHFRGKLTVAGTKGPPAPSPKLAAAGQ